MAVKFYHFIFIFLCMNGLFSELTGAEKTKIKAIVFDFGGVIAKTDRKQIADYLSESLQISPEETQYALKKLKENNLHDGEENEYWLKYARSKGKKLPDNWLTQLSDVRYRALQVIPGMVDLVKNLKKQGLQTALLSNVRKSQAKIKRKLGCYDLFEPALLSYQTGFRKPDPRAYQLMLKKLNLSPQEIIFIDNKTENVAAAKALGIDAILFENLNQLVEELKKRGIRA